MNLNNMKNPYAQPAPKNAQPMSKAAQKQFSTKAAARAAADKNRQMKKDDDKIRKIQNNKYIEHEHLDKIGTTRREGDLRFLPLNPLNSQQENLDHDQ